MRRRVSISDVHGVDRDFLHEQGNGGETGLELFTSFVAWVIETDTMVLSLGDFWNFTRRLAEDLITLKDVMDEKALEHFIFLAGNHDPLQGVALLRYVEEKVFEVEVERRIKKGMLFGSNGVAAENIIKTIKIIMTHGDLFDPFWNPENLELKSTRRRLWWGQEIIKRGWQAERVHPDLDNWVMRIGHRLQDRLVKKGSRIPDKEFKEKAVACCKERGGQEIITGHSHGPGEDVIDGIRYVNLGSWEPCNGSSPDGLYRRGDVWPGVYEWDSGILYRWMDGALHVPVLAGHGEWRYSRAAV